MEKSDWLVLTKDERVKYISDLLSELIKIDKKQHELSKCRGQGAIGNIRFNLENEVLKILNWEKLDK